MNDQIIRLLAHKDYVPANVPELLELLHLTPNQQQELQAVLQKLEQSGAIARIKGNRYVLPQEADLIPGRIRMNRAGKGFLQPDDPALKEIAIAESATGTALHEDRVLVRRNAHRKHFHEEDQETGTVVRILERKRTQIVGTLQQGKQFLYVIPDDPRIPHDIYVTPPRDLGRPARVGDKVVVNLHEWESPHTNPEGEIMEVLGAPDAEGVDMLSAIPWTRAIWLTASIAAAIRSSPLIRMTPKISMTPSVWSAWRRTNGVCGCTSPTCRIT
jgi:ribonuclease R